MIAFLAFSNRVPVFGGGCECAVSLQCRAGIVCASILRAPARPSRELGVCRLLDNECRRAGVDGRRFNSALCCFRSRRSRCRFGLRPAALASRWDEYHLVAQARRSRAHP